MKFYLTTLFTILNITKQQLNCQDIIDQSRRTVCVATSITEKEYEQQFTQFITDFDKQYSSQNQMNERFKIFKDNYLKVKVHNTDPNKTYKQEINEFSDLTTQEFEDRYLSKFAEEDPNQREQVLLGSNNDQVQVETIDNNKVTQQDTSQQQLRGTIQNKNNNTPKIFKGTRSQRFKLIILNKNAEMNNDNYRYVYNEEKDEIEKVSL